MSHRFVQNLDCHRQFTQIGMELLREEKKNYDGLSADEKREIRAIERERKNECEAGMKRQAQPVPAAKKATKGIKSTKPF